MHRGGMSQSKGRDPGALHGQVNKGVILQSVLGGMEAELTQNTQGQGSPLRFDLEYKKMGRGHASENRSRGEFLKLW